MAKEMCQKSESIIKCNFDLHMWASVCCSKFAFIMCLGPRNLDWHLCHIGFKELGGIPE